MLSFLVFPFFLKRTHLAVFPLLSCVIITFSIALLWWKLIPRCLGRVVLFLSPRSREWVVSRGGLLEEHTRMMNDPVHLKRHSHALLPLVLANIFKTFFSVSFSLCQLQVPFSLEGLGCCKSHRVPNRHICESQ